MTAYHTNPLALNRKLKRGPQVAILTVGTPAGPNSPDIMFGTEATVEVYNDTYNGNGFQVSVGQGSVGLQSVQMQELRLHALTEACFIARRLEGLHTWPAVIKAMQQYEWTAADINQKDNS